MSDTILVGMDKQEKRTIMKRILLLLCFIASTFAAKAIDYAEARQQAWFLTDKMAYELNLTPEQYDRAYEINLDYLMSLRTPCDCSGYYWQYRNTDFRYILFDWQYNLYCTLDYFFRPVRWSHATWYYPVFDRYRHGYYYFARPRIYVTYQGGIWSHRGRNTPSPYIGRRPEPGTGMRNHYQSNIGGPSYGRPPQPRPGDRPGRPEGDRPGRPNDNRPDRPNGNRPGEGNRPGNADRPNRPNDNRPGNGGNRPGGNRNDGNRSNNGRPNNGYRDAYTNYRQTGNSGSTYNSGSRPSGNAGGRGNTTGVGGQRQQRTTQGTNSSAQGSRGGNRSFGGR